MYQANRSGRRLGRRVSPFTMDIRRSQLITPFGTGSLFDMQNRSVIICDSENWNPNTVADNTFDDIRLEEAMHASGFVEPPAKADGSAKDHNLVTDLPSWYFSPITRDLKTLQDWRKYVSPSDQSRFERVPFHIYHGHKVELVPVRIICVCSAGHIQDFPWQEWAHSGSGQAAPVRQHELTLKNAGGNGTINNIVVQCSCNKKRSLQGIFGTGAGGVLKHIGVSCKGLYQWKHNEEATNCEELLKPMLRSANSLYFPNVVSSVNIPLTENVSIEAIKSAGAYRFLQDYLSNKGSVERQIQLLDDGDDSYVVSKITDIAREVEDRIEESVSSEEVLTQIVENLKSTYDDNQNADETSYRRAEYDVLRSDQGYERKTGRLDLRVQDMKEELPEDGLADYLQCVTLVNQLEVVSVLKSFSRIRPIDSDLLIDEGIQGTDDNDLTHSNVIREVSLRRSDGKYVGLRNHGEGIFVCLSPEKVLAWEKSISGTDFERRILNKAIGAKVNDYLLQYITPAFYMLHTLSHIVLRELSFTSGYSSSALRERLYYSDGTAGDRMCGFLIYTSSSDADGTLGGLVRQGLPGNFMSILRAALEKAKWCSYDPSCIETMGQGRDSLNLAACHACALVSETSCERGNLLLDRGVLIGVPDSEGKYACTGFFQSHI